MQNQFTERMAGKSDDELIAVLTINRRDYIGDALTAAQAEFDKRQIAPERIATVQAEQAVLLEKKQSQDNEPLEIGVKVLCMFLPFLTALFYWSVYEREGYKRKKTELGKMVLNAWLIRFGLIFLIVLLSKL
jgi:hypothetical protein